MAVQISDWLETPMAVGLVMRLLVFWFTPLVSGLIDFSDTMLVCGIVIGIGLGIAVATAASTAAA